MPDLRRAGRLLHAAERFAAAGFRLYLVGGVVRDAILGRLGDRNDLDFTTDAPPDDIERVLQGWADALWAQGKRFGTIGAKVETLFGGHISMLTGLCERARADAFDILLAHAQKVGANAVVGIRYDATEIMSGVTEVLCYGTAVVVEPA